ncbi:MAG TPA: sigma-70 family RNA polymerase sigma factor [Tepidisphaeraceae bacterium]|nr:sigma-70 family RNA polymerase sigma factor [Tepidisphaeraceae bacterium]
MELFWPHRDVVVRTARVLMRHQAEADDLAQETMLKAFRAVDRFEAGTDARAWLLTILRNSRVDRLRSNAVRATVSLEAVVAADAVQESSEPHQYAPSTDPDLILEQFSDAEVIDALQELSEDMRWTLLLIDVEGLDHADAAQILQVPIGTIKSRAHRGRLILRDRLESRAKQMRLIR